MRFEAINATFYIETKEIALDLLQHCLTRIRSVFLCLLKMSSFSVMLEGILHHNIFFLLLLFVIVATEAETVRCTQYKDFKTRRDLNLFVQCVC